MKHYNVDNYIRYKTDIKASASDEDLLIDALTRDELIIRFMPMVESAARKFSTTTQASGILTIMDLIQEGNYGLIAATDKINWAIILESADPTKTLKSFLYKRIKGAIRRAIDINRGSIKIPEYKLNEIRNEKDPDSLIVRMFFNSIFTSVDSASLKDEDGRSIAMDIPDNSTPYNIDILNIYLLSIMKKSLTDKEYEIIRMSYGLDCNKMSSKEIAAVLNMTSEANTVRISQIKKVAIDKLLGNIDPDQIIDYLEDSE